MDVGVEVGVGIVGQANFLWGGQNYLTRVVVSENFRNGGVKTYVGKVKYSVLSSTLEMRVNWVKFSAPSSKFSSKRF